MIISFLKVKSITLCKVTQLIMQINNSHGVIILHQHAIVQAFQNTLVTSTQPAFSESPHLLKAYTVEI